MRSEVREFLEQLKFLLAPSHLHDVRKRARELLREDQSRIDDYINRQARGYCECDDPLGAGLCICPDCDRYYTELSSLQSLV